MRTSSSAAHALRKFATKQKANNLSRFFKTGKGEYGEGDKFLGIMVPQIRGVVKRYRDLTLSETMKLVRSPWHEERLCGLLILVDQFERRDEKTRKRIYDTYLKSTKWINNWDLVDLTTPNIVGAYLKDKPRSVLMKLTRSKNLWERRIAVLATFRFIKDKDFKDALKIAHTLRNDSHDLIHKAVGWMLREVGKRDVKALERFLDEHRRHMPRTMLRYAIEKFPEKKRRSYLRR
jgi:3-methyladenine DNA glycosylase AlkD